MYRFLSVCVFFFLPGGPWDSLLTSHGGSRARSTQPGVGIMTPKGSGTNGALVKWFRFYSMAVFGDQNFSMPQLCRCFDWKASNLLTQPQEKTSLNHLLSNIVWKVKTQWLWKRQTLLSTNTPLNFILVTLPNKIGYFCHLGNEFLLICGYTSPPWKNRIRWSFPFEKNDPPFPSRCEFFVEAMCKEIFPFCHDSAWTSRWFWFGSPEV